MPLSSPYLRALRRCSPTTLNTHVPAKAFRSLSETGLRAEVARCSHPLEEIRFSNPSLVGTVVSYDADILQFRCLPFCTGTAERTLR